MSLLGIAWRNIRQRLLTSSLTALSLALGVALVVATLVTGSIVNQAIVEAQVNGAVALGLSQTLVEESVWVDGQPRARNFDRYPILPPARLSRVHVRVVESG